MTKLGKGKSKSKKVAAPAPSLAPAALPPSSRSAGSPSTPQPMERILSRHNPALQAALVLIVGSVIYANALNVPFYFDDAVCIVNNPAIFNFEYLKDLSKLADLPTLQDIKNNVVLRPVAYLSFALNYHFHGLDVSGYHAINIFIHVVNALLFYQLVRLTLRAATITARDPNQSCLAKATRFMPLFGALLFVAHPLQTQAVTYIVQRFTSLATLFYLAALVMYVAARLSPGMTKRRVLYVLSVAATVLAMKTKEIAFTLPIMLTLYECLFFKEGLQKRFIRLLPYFATLAIIPYTVISLASGTHPVNPALVDDPTNLVNLTNMSRWDYLITQFGVITTYLRLLILPINQNLDYDYPLARDFFSPEVLLPLFLLVVLFGGAILLWRRTLVRETAFNPLMRIMAFGILWFFVTLSVESTLIPLDDVIFEHRVYLPSIGFFLCCLAGISLVQMKYMVATPCIYTIARNMLVAATLLCSVATVARNIIWQEPVIFWQDVVGKSPGKARPHNQFAMDLLRLKRFDEAIFHFQQALALGDNPLKIHRNLVVAYLYMERPEEARREIEPVLQAYPDDAGAHLNLGAILELEGRYQEAIEELNYYLRKNNNEQVREKIQALSKQLGTE